MRPGCHGRLRKRGVLRGSPNRPKRGGTGAALRRVGGEARLPTALLALTEIRQARVRGGERLMADDFESGSDPKRGRRLVARSVPRKEVDYRLIVQALLMIAEDLQRDEAAEKDAKEAS